MFFSGFDVSVFFVDIEDADDAIAAANRKHLPIITEVHREARPRKIENSIAWFEEVLTV